ncbi:MAG: hypothetical protein LUE29_07730 [Lachnospiraceae bacterium]|nr:hypothetical protein [Lachnospiraceae bacterium]
MKKKFEEPKLTLILLSGADVYCDVSGGDTSVLPDDDSDNSSGSDS